MEKEQIRSGIRKKKRALTSETRSQWNKEILNNLFSLPQLVQSTCIFTYVSYNQEVDTKEFIVHCIKAGKKIAVPKVVEGDMEFYYIRGLEELQVGYQGIEEPVGRCVAKPTKEEACVMILPGLAFSREGDRIGYGGGFYDRYLERFSECELTTCGVAYEFQVFDTLPREVFDQRIEVVVTEKKIYE